jgi:transposase
MSLARTSGEPEPVAPGPPGSTKSSLLHPAMSSRVERAWGDHVMDILYPCCAGLDVHKKTVVACIRRLGPEGQPDEQVRTFGTMTGDLLELADWLAANGVVQVAMESTGVYWKPVYYLLEDLFAVMLVNAQHIKQVPGRKTDVKDCQWIAQLLQHGLLRPSFVPPTEIRELRDLTRQRSQLISERAAVANRIQKVLEDANIKLASVASEVLGVSGRAMIAALIAGQTEPERLAELARRKLRRKLPQLKQALHGRVTDHHRFMLRTLMDHVRHLDQLIEQFNDRIDEVMTPFAPAVDRLVTIPGVSRHAAEVIVAEIGTDMKRFPTAGHLSSWAGMCSGNHQSAGKRQSGRTTKGDRWLRQTLVQVAWAASHTKGTFLAATYHRWVKRMGKKRALVALGHKILVIIYELLKDQTTYVERPPLDNAA